MTIAMVAAWISIVEHKKVVISFILGKWWRYVGHSVLVVDCDNIHELIILVFLFQLTNAEKMCSSRTCWVCMCRVCNRRKWKKCCWVHRIKPRVCYATHPSSTHILHTRNLFFFYISSNLITFSFFFDVQHPCYDYSKVMSGEPSHIWERNSIVWDVVRLGRTHTPSILFYFLFLRMKSWLWADVEFLRMCFEFLCEFSDFHFLSFLLMFACYT